MRLLQKNYILSSCNVLKNICCWLLWQCGRSLPLIWKETEKYFCPSTSRLFSRHVWYVAKIRIVFHIIVDIRQQSPQKMRELLPRVTDVRKKCGSCCHVSPMSAKNAEAVATCHQCAQKMRELLPRVNDVCKKCGSCCHVVISWFRLTLVYWL